MEENSLKVLFGFLAVLFAIGYWTTRSRPRLHRLYLLMVSPALLAGLILLMPVDPTYSWGDRLAAAVMAAGAAVVVLALATSNWLHSRSWLVYVLLPLALLATFLFALNIGMWFGMPR